MGSCASVKQRGSPVGSTPDNQMPGSRRSNSHMPRSSSTHAPVSPIMAPPSSPGTPMSPSAHRGSDGFVDKLFAVGGPSRDALADSTAGSTATSVTRAVAEANRAPSSERSSYSNTVRVAPDTVGLPSSSSCPPSTIPTSPSSTSAGTSTTTTTLSPIPTPQTPAATGVEMLATPVSLFKADLVSGFEAWLAHAPSRRSVDMKVFTREGGTRHEPILYVAAQHGASACIELLLQRGSPVNVTTTSGFTPLHAASFEGHVSTVRVLLGHGANVSVASTTANAMRLPASVTALHRAAAAAGAGKDGAAEVVSVLLSHGASATDLDGLGDSPYDAFCCALAMAKHTTPSSSPLEAWLGLFSAHPLTTNNPDSSSSSSSNTTTPKSTAFLGQRSLKALRSPGGKKNKKDAKPSAPTPLGLNLLPASMSLRALNIGEDEEVEHGWTNDAADAESAAVSGSGSGSGSVSAQQPDVPDLPVSKWRVLQQEVRGLLAKSRFQPLGGGPAAGSGGGGAGGGGGLGSLTTATDSPTAGGGGVGGDKKKKPRPRRQLSLNTLGLEINSRSALPTLGNVSRNLDAGYEPPVDEGRRAHTPRGRHRGLRIATSDEELLYSPGSVHSPPHFSTSSSPRLTLSLKSKCKLVVWDFDRTVLRIHSYGKRIRPEAVPVRDLNMDFADLEFFTRLIRALVASGIKVAIASFGKYDVIQAYLDRAFDLPGVASTPVNRLLPKLGAPSSPSSITSPSSPKIGLPSTGPIPASPARTASSRSPVPASPSGVTASTTAGAGVDPSSLFTPEPGSSWSRRSSMQSPLYFGRENIITPSMVGGMDGSSLRGGKKKQLALLCQWAGVAAEEVLFFDDDLKNIDMAKDDGYLNSVCTPDGFTRDVWSSAITSLYSA